MPEATTTGFTISGYVPAAVELQEVADLIAGAIDRMQTGHDAWFGPLLFARVGALAGLPLDDAPGLPAGYKHVLGTVLVAARMGHDDVEGVATGVFAAVSERWNARWTDSKPAGLPSDALTWAKMRDLCTHWSRSRSVDPELEEVARVAIETPVNRITPRTRR